MPRLCDTTHRGRRLLAAGFVLLAAAPACFGQPTEGCAGADLTGTDLLPWVGSFTPASFDFNLSGGGCFQPPFGVDAVVCLAPTSSCSVNFSCAFPSSQRVEVNVRDMGAGGACTTAAGTCVAGTGVDAGAGNNATSPLSVTSVPLLAGNRYCFICSTSDQTPVVQQTFTITGTGCGALPVTLERFEVDDGMAREGRPH